METDAFFCQLLKQLPETLFALLGLPPELARDYRFDSVEVKKSFRIDGVLLPQRSDLPVYFVEVQFQRLAAFYANLFAKVFSYLEENDPGQEWKAVALFGSRKIEPTKLSPYKELLESDRVRRVYLDEFPMPADAPLGLGLVQLVSAPENEVKELVGRMIHKAEHETADSETARKVIELAEELLLRRFTELDREEVRKMFKLHDIRKSKVWQEAHESGREEGKEEGREEGIEIGREEGESRILKRLVQKHVAQGVSVKEIAAMLDLPVKDVRRLAKE